MHAVARVPLNGEADVLGALAAHVEACRRDLSAHPRPPLYAAGVRYSNRDPEERWQTPSETHARRAGDCEDLASWRCAELRNAGERCRVTVRRSRPGVLHAVVEREDGRIEDPSRRLGMGRGRIAGMASEPNLRWNIKRTSDGWEGTATIPMPAGAASITARAAGRTRGDAASRTLRAIEDVTRSPLIASILPPGAGPAIKAALGVARSVARLFKRKKKKAAAAGTTVSGMGIGARDVARSLRARGAPPELVRLGAACWGE